MARERRDRRTLTMQTRSAARKEALVRLGKEWLGCLEVGVELQNTDATNPLLKDIKRKQYILEMMQGFCEHARRDHLILMNDVKADAPLAVCVNAVCDGKDNPFSTEHPLLATWIRDNYHRDIVRADLRIYTLPYSAGGPSGSWLDLPYLCLNEVRVPLAAAFVMLDRIYLDRLMRKRCAVTTRLKDGRLRDCKHGVFTVMRLRRARPH